MTRTYKMKAKSNDLCMTWRAVTNISNRTRHDKVLQLSPYNGTLNNGVCSSGLHEKNTFCKFNVKIIVEQNTAKKSFLFRFFNLSNYWDRAFTSKYIFPSKYENVDKVLFKDDGTKISTSRYLQTKYQFCLTPTFPY